MVVVLWAGEGVARDGRPYRNTYSWFMQLQDGQVVDVVTFFDSVEFNDFGERVSPE